MPEPTTEHSELLYRGPYVAMRDTRTGTVSLVPAKLEHGQWVALTPEEITEQSRYVIVDGAFRARIAQEPSR